MFMHLNTRLLSPMKFSPAFFQLKLFKSENLRVSSFGRSVAYLGLVARHLMRTEKTGDKCFFLSLRSFTKQILVISSAVRGCPVKQPTLQKPQ